MIRVNCVTQLLFSRFYLASKKPCFIIDYSSINALCCPGGTIVYNSCKGFNSYLSQGIGLSDVEVLTVYPASVKSFMNEGRGTFVVSAPQHARAVLSQLGRDKITFGHWIHGARDFLLNYWVFRKINSWESARRRAIFDQECSLRKYDYNF